MDTRSTIYLLLDYNTYYNLEATIEDAITLIKDIPSSTLLNYISGFSANLYLYDNDENSGKIQFMLISSLLSRCDKKIQAKWVTEVRKHEGKGFAPMMFWNYSNLLFYNLIFRTFNDYSSRDLNSEEAKRVFDAYLIINGIANERIKIDEKDIKKAQQENKLGELLTASFMYQKDYASSIDFSNQVTRGASFFKYLENDPKYRDLVLEYYKSKNISGYLRMFRNLFVLFTEINIGKDLENRNQLANLQEYLEDEVDFPYIETFCINKEISNYKEDESFGILRNKFLYKLSSFQFLILNVNFLLDQFYKAQVFSFNAFLKNENIKGEFLSEKGKNFAEEIYLRSVLDTCFPTFTKFYGSQCINSRKEELCDAYIRDSNKIFIVEFKDVLLNASVKNNADKEKLFNELDKKFLANQTKKPKGITQLLNAIKDIDKHSVSFDEVIPNYDLKIYPIIIYTDTTFGVEGVNKYYNEKFNEEVRSLTLQNVNVKDVVFINLNYFELHQDYLNLKYLDIFKLLDSYIEHISNINYSSTPFEIFSRFYMKTNVQEELATITSFKKLINSIITAK